MVDVLDKSLYAQSGCVVCTRCRTLWRICVHILLLAVWLLAFVLGSTCEHDSSDWVKHYMTVYKTLVPRSLYHTLELGCSIEDLDYELEPICRLLDDADIVYEVKMGMNYVPRYKNTRSQSDIVCEKVHFMFLDDADCTAAELIIGELDIK